MKERKLGKGNMMFTGESKALEFKLGKGNMLFIEEPKVLEFIEYCKNKYSQNIKSIEINLYDEEDAKGDEWMMTVSECSNNKEQGMVWVPWYIPTLNPPQIMESDIASKFTNKGKYDRDRNDKEPDTGGS